MPESSPALSIDHLAYRWPGAARNVLEIDALTLDADESLFLYGPSGCGKSTLLAAIAGTIPTRPGQIRVNGVEVGALRGGARDRFRGDHIGLIFQVLNLVPWMSARDNVCLPFRFAPHRRQRIAGSPEAEAQRLLSELDLAEELHHAPARTLSIGQQQRVAAARALIGRPSLILADEPTSALDEDRKAGFVDLLARECQAAGAALLFVSHDRGLERHFDRTLDFRDLNPHLAA